TDHAAMKCFTGNGIHFYGGQRTGFDARELVFLEIGVDPQTIRGHERDELRTHRGIRTDLRTAVADDAVDGRAQLGVILIEAGKITFGSSLRERGLRLLLLRSDDFKLPFGGGETGARAIARGEGFGI